MANIDPEKEVETPMEVAAMTEAPKVAESGSKLPAVKKTIVLHDTDKKMMSDDIDHLQLDQRSDKDRLNIKHMEKYSGFEKFNLKSFISGLVLDIST